MKKYDVEMCVEFNASLTVKANSESEAHKKAIKMGKENPSEYFDDVCITEITFSKIVH